MDALLGSLHATEHAQIAVLPLIAMCDRWDIGGLSTNMHPQTGGPTIFIYDGHPGGIGITRLAYRALRGALPRRPPADRRVPLQKRLPLLRAVAEVRQPQRTAVEGGRFGGVERDAGDERTRAHRGLTAPERALAGPPGGGYPLFPAAIFLRSIVSS